MSQHNSLLKTAFLLMLECLGAESRIGGHEFISGIGHKDGTGRLLHIFQNEVLIRCIHAQGQITDLSLDLIPVTGIL